MSADVHAYFAAVRAHYLEVLRRGVREAKPNGGQVLVEVEVGIEKPDGTAADVPGELALPYRYDIVILDADGGAQPIMPVADHAIAWEPAAFDFGGPFVARVEHFVWNVCVVVGRPAPPRAQWELLRTWFMAWFHRDAGDAPFSGVVHFMSDPEPSEKGDLLRVQVDLGSAPTAALVELLATFGQMGCRDGLVYTPEGALEAP